MLNITRDGVPTLADMLNFVLYPQGHFPQLGITAIVVPGTQIGDTAADYARFTNNTRYLLVTTEYTDCAPAGSAAKRVLYDILPPKSPVARAVCPSLRPDHFYRIPHLPPCRTRASPAVGQLAQWPVQIE